MTSGRVKQKNISKSIAWRFILPNVITCLALVCGVTAIRLGIDGEFLLAVSAIILAMALDAIDGRVARALDGVSPFGAELDSLADLINFGVAPGVLVWLWSLHTLGNAGWLVVIIFALACCVRLARFNVMTADPAQPTWKAKYFTGVNAPAGAVLSLAPLYLGFAGFVTDGETIARYAAVYLAAVAGLMVSRTPTFSFKQFKLTPARKIFLAAALLLLAPCLFVFPWYVMLIGSSIYLLLIPFSIVSYRHDSNRTAESAEVDDSDTAGRTIVLSN